ncbi:MAG: amidohydrolase [Proteobacteria bacterium]|nr:amidohydrolase [Pseudomonadota bacterium]
MTTVDYRMHDADNHYYEADDCFTRHIESAFRERTVWVDRTKPGPGRMYVGDERCHFFSVGAGDSVGPPGLMRDFLRGLSEEGGSPSLQPIDGLAVPEFVEKQARLRKLDEQGVESCLMLPTAGVGVEPQLRQPKHRDALYPSLRAFNRWLEEDWGYGADGRIYGAPLISLADLDAGLAELDRLIERGARFVVLTAGPVNKRSPGDPYFDRFWARCQEAQVAVVYHIGHTPFGEMYSRDWGLRPHPPSHRHSLMEYMLAFTERPVVDTLASLIADNLFGRFPALRILSVEYGSSWVAPLLRKLDHLARLYSKDMWRFGAPPEKPSELFRRHVWISPFFEDDLVGLVDTLGADHVLAGSDYPHPEGLAQPIEFAEGLEGLDPATTRRILRDNFAELVAG